MSLEALVKTWTPEMYSILGGLLKPTFPEAFVAPDYALGWQRSYYRGHSVIEHSGGTIGHSSYVFAYPDDNVGIFFSGIGDAGAINTIEYLAHMFIADLYLGYEPWLNIANSCTFPCTWVPCTEERSTSSSDGGADDEDAFHFDVDIGASGSNENVQSLSKLMKGRKFSANRTKCESQVANEFVGRYEDPGWGTVVVTYSEEFQVMLVDFHDLAAVLVDVGMGDIFGIAAINEYATLFGDGLFSLFTFNRDDQGRVVSVTGNDWDVTSEPTFQRVTSRSHRSTNRHLKK